jgi:hypothetical protein
MAEQVIAAERQSQLSAGNAAAAQRAFLDDPLGDQKLERTNAADRAATGKNIDWRKAVSKFTSFDSPAYYMVDLPKAAAVAKTDADGKFSLSVPQGRYVIAAQASRSVFRDTEYYYWLVAVDGTKPQALMLSNDNQVQTGCAECVRLPAPPPPPHSEIVKAKATPAQRPRSMEAACVAYLKERLETPAKGFTFYSDTRGFDSIALKGAAISEDNSKRPFTCYLEGKGDEWIVKSAGMTPW